MIGSGLGVAAYKALRANARIRKVECPILDQMTERAKVLIGEINADITSLDLRNELSRILLII